MCDSRQPANGADSVQPEQPYRVTLHDHDDGTHTFLVSAIGPLGAEGTAKDEARRLGIDVSSVLRVEVAS